MKLSIVVPCYNEADNIPDLLEAYKKSISKQSIEVVLVNNGSTDNTADVLSQLLPQYESFLRVVTVPVNKGYGFGILEGLRVSTGEFIGWTHGDLQTPSSDVIKAMGIIEAHDLNTKLFIKGERVGRPIFDQFFTRGMSIFETIYLGKKLHDINAQPNIFHRDYFLTWANPPIDFSLDLYVLYLAQCQNLNIVRFPVLFLKRQHGTSKWNTGILAKWKFIKRTIDFSIKLKTNNLSR